jgi:hypothetical protein
MYNSEEEEGYEVEVMRLSCAIGLSRTLIGVSGGDG